MRWVPISCGGSEGTELPLLSLCKCFSSFSSEPLRLEQKVFLMKLGFLPHPQHRALGTRGAELRGSSGCQQRSFTKPKGWGRCWRPPLPLPRGDWFLGRQHPPRDMPRRSPNPFCFPHMQREQAPQGEEDEGPFQGYKLLIFGRLSLLLELTQAASC